MDGMQYASAVITHDWSDWSIKPLDNPPAIWLRVVRHGGSVEVHASTDGSAFSLIRQGYLTENATISVGPMIAAPTGQGFTARFTDFVVKQ